MPENILPTAFMPAETASHEEVRRQHKLISEAPIVISALNGILGFSLILNRQRQLVFVNKAMYDFLREHDLSPEIGGRTGNLFGCIHPAEAEGGCGTTEACRRCGAGMAIAEALENKEAVNECRILSKKSGDELDLRVRVQPFQYGGEDFLLMSLMDISDEKRRQVLERIFFHDIINTAGGVHGLISLMVDSSPEEAHTYVPATAKAADRLIEQLLSQKDLSAAERGELAVKIEELEAASFLSGIADLFKAHEAAKGRNIVIDTACAGLTLLTDRTLLARVIGNMTKNALEAESAGAVITLACAKTAGGVAFTVKNPTPMSEDTRLQVFQRSFSTKGAGRGLGTYSMRLLTERYLKGKISCSSDAGGTVFKAEYPASI
ncbi:MAG: HAMP domain-containing sensor histidine kinase [Elusimicrobiota bacterium]